jgi:5-methylcytosine-specific restriction enzyme subunit McrC
MRDLEVLVASGATTTSADSETVPPSDPIELEEHDHTEPFPISDEDIDFIQNLSEDTSPLTLEFDRNGNAILNSSKYVGAVTLPSGTKVEITPKQTVSRLVWLLEFALDVPSETIEKATPLAGADTFIDAFAVLFHAELKHVLQQGIRREYQRTQGIKNAVRGRLDVTRQIQRQGLAPTDFAVEYDEFTADTPLNQGVLAATDILTMLVSNNDLAADLDYQRQQLRQFVSPEPVTRADLESVDITRLNEQYADLFALTKLVLSRQFFEDVRIGERESYGLFMNMNDVFEKVTERAFSEAANSVGYEVHGQSDIAALIDGPHSVSMTPDIAVRNGEGNKITMIGDAKWKTSPRTSSDVYQITSYMLAEQASGLLIYPEQGGDRVASSKLQNTLPLISTELPTATDAEKYEGYCAALIDHAATILECISSA